MCLAPGPTRTGDVMSWAPLRDVGTGVSIERMFVVEVTILLPSLLLGSIDRRSGRFDQDGSLRMTVVCERT